MTWVQCTALKDLTSQWEKKNRSHSFQNCMVKQILNGRIQRKAYPFKNFGLPRLEFLKFILNSVLLGSE
jgi:hypothetical protein